MTNVIHVRFPTPEDRRASYLGPVLDSFASARRASTDVFWLKENCELLNILETTGSDVPRARLKVYERAYDELPERMAFFPQYYRFLLSMSLDLEALGIPGNVGDALCDHVLSQRLVEGETSDIQRLEAQRLLARRGRIAPIDDGARDRALAFINHPDRFALPNKKAAYELTHIVFYFTEYGSKSVDLGENVLQSLENVGIWAFLDGNADLLAEICIAMRYLGHNPTAIWEENIAFQMKNAHVTTAAALPQGDDYHSVFVGVWLQAVQGIPAFSSLRLPNRQNPDEPVLVMNPAQARSGALRELSRHLFTLGAARSGDWGRMETRLEGALSQGTQERLRTAAQASQGFERFFESFARAVPA